MEGMLALLHTLTVSLLSPLGYCHRTIVEDGQGVFGKEPQGRLESGGLHQAYCQESA